MEYKCVINGFFKSYHFDVSHHQPMVDITNQHQKWLCKKLSIKKSICYIKTKINALTINDGIHIKI